MTLEEELEKFKKFQLSYQFKQKEIVEKDGNLYCDGELLQEQDEKPVGESEKWINVGFKLKGDYSKVLSNLFPYEFTFREKKLHSIESFFQGIKMKDINLQNEVFKYSGIESNVIKIACEEDWKERGILYWQGTPIKRDSKEYDDLVRELYVSAIQNPIFRNILKKVDKPIIHSIGKERKEETVFTRVEFEYMLNSLVAFLKEEE